jgi:hypothetical protein
VHFFGTKRWSTEALSVMKRVLPPSGASDGL